MRRQLKTSRFTCPLCSAKHVIADDKGEYTCMQCNHEWLNKYDYMIDYSVIMCSPSEMMEHI